MNYYVFTDWAGCPGYGKCGLCGKIRDRSWGDSYHEQQAPLGHNGIDIGVKRVNVYASAAGTVAYTGFNNPRGNYIIIEHLIAGTGYSYYSYYQHLEKIYINKGTKVSAGDTIALSGNTGVGSGYHLHFGIVMALSGTNISTRLYEIENKGWLTTDGYGEGRILNNPSTTSQFPTGNTAVLAPLAAHSGSVSYTFDKNKVVIGGRTDSSTTQSVTPAAVSISIGSGSYDPGTLKQGLYYSINGEIKSNYNLTNVTVGIYNSNGTATSYVRTVNPGKTSYNISAQNYYMMFNKLAVGTYYFKVIATDASGTTKTLVNNSFTVQNPASTLSIASGKYNPGTLKLGSYYSISGEIKSNYNLTNITVGIYNSNGAATSYVRTANPGKMSYNISTQDYYMMFNKLAKGTYYFKVIATDAFGTTKTLVNNQFTIK